MRCDSRWDAVLCGGNEPVCGSCWIHSMVHAANLTPEQLAQIIELAAKGTVGVFPEQADEPENYNKEDMENEY